MTTMMMMMILDVIDKQSDLVQMVQKQQMNASQIVGKEKDGDGQMIDNQID